MDSSTRSTKWNRVSRANPCPICGKPDWCLTTGPADSPDAVICARVESTKRAGDGGWLHRLRDAWRDRPRQRRVTIDTPAEPAIDFDALAMESEAALGPHCRALLAVELGVTIRSLERLGVGWSVKYGAFTFPMTDAAGKVRGIRLRGRDGRKWSVKGGREGLFIGAPSGLHLGSRLLVCEGATDVAALFDLGFAAVGRPSCTGGTSLLVDFVKTNSAQYISDVVIVGDADAPGQRGARRLAAALVPYCRGVRTIFPPTDIKDVRAWVQAGATADDIRFAIDAAPVLQLRYSAQAVAR